jgi:hypothetical protein
MNLARDHRGRVNLIHPQKKRPSAPTGPQMKGWGLYIASIADQGNPSKDL